MLNNIALEVVVGLIFVYLLYSLLATVIAEMFATQIGLRAYNLKEGVDRMLHDENENEKGFWFRFLDSLKLRKNPQNPMVRNFYNHAEIKYLGSSGIFKTPSCFKAVSFSKTLMYSLSGEGAVDKTKIRAQLVRLVNPVQSNIGDNERILDVESARYVLSLWDDSYDDIVKFKLLLENWFDRTMEQTTEWYKRKIQLILLVLGFLLAWFFNADTFAIVNKLSTDKDAREQMVRLAVAHQQRDTSTQEKEKIDQQLQQDIASANSILGTGGWPPDTAGVFIDAKTGKQFYIPALDFASLTSDQQKARTGKIGFDCLDKWCYLLWLLLNHWLGFFVTAVAISLGAPFWYDMLNRIMKLRTAVKQPDNTSELAQNDGVSPLMREA